MKYHNELEEFEKGFMEVERFSVAPKSKPQWQGEVGLLWVNGMKGA